MKQRYKSFCTSIAFSMKVIREKMAFLVPLSEVKTTINAKQQNLFKQPPPTPTETIHTTCSLAMSRCPLFRLRTGHNRLRNHLFHKLKIGDTDQCRCRTGSQTTEHLLPFCACHESLLKQIWPDHGARKLVLSPWARPNTHEPETLRQPGGHATHCYLCCEEWRDHLTKEEEEEEAPLSVINPNWVSI